MNPTTIAKNAIELVSAETDYVVPLAVAHDADVCGGKASSLATIIDLGLPVPDGFVITDMAFQEALDSSDLRKPVEEILRKVDVSRPEILQQIERDIHGIMRAVEIPGAILQSIQVARKSLFPATAVAVRSSAIGEDSAAGAFAGQLDTFLNVESDASLLAALRACWASYWSQRSLFYQFSRGIRLQGMAVIVQRMVPSQIAGVLFTRSPHSSIGTSDLMVAEYCYGQGEQLVSGKINPGRITIHRETLECSRVTVPERSSSADCESSLTDRQVALLARYGLKLEEAFGYPQDIEWAIDDAQELYLVQSRPITTLRSPPSVGPSSNHRVLWSNANVNENYPDAISPLLYSIASSAYYYYFRNLGLAIGISRSRVEAMEHALRHIIGVHGARMYYNLSSIHACLRMAPCGELLVGSFNQFVGAAEVAPNHERNWKSFTRSRVAVAMELCRIGFRSTWQFAGLSRGVTRFEKRVDEFADQTHPMKLRGRPREALLDDLRGFMHIRCHGWTSASLADAAAMLSYSALKRLLNREFPDEDLASLHNSLLKGLRDIVSGGPIIDLWNLAQTIRAVDQLRDYFTDADPAKILERVRGDDKLCEIRRQFDEFLERWGYRCSGELMLTIPSYQENPAALIELLQAYVRTEGPSPVDRLQQQECERKAETTRIVRQIKKRKTLLLLPRWDKSLLLRTLLKWTHTAIALRERARLKQALLYSRCRRIALEIGNQLVDSNQLEQAEDAFFLTYSELESLLAGSDMYPYQVKELTQLRENGHAELGRMQPADSFQLDAGAYLPLSALACDRALDAQPAGNEQLAGVGACGGSVTARAAILNDVSECRLLSRGDILVARQTDPGWGPLFFLIHGLVLERGGMLSHGAILAREYGIPTVVGVENATTRIAHGQVLTVNGDRGVVQLARS